MTNPDGGSDAHWLAMMRNKIYRCGRSWLLPIVGKTLGLNGDAGGWFSCTTDRTCMINVGLLVDVAIDDFAEVYFQ